MSSILNNIYKVTKDQYDQLIKNGSIAGHTYDSSAIYLVEEEEKTLTIKSLDTSYVTSLTPDVNESILGTGTIGLHKISKTGHYDDLIGTPTIPTVYDGTLTLKASDGVTATQKTFTANDSDNVTFEVKHAAPTGAAAGSYGPSAGGKQTAKGTLDIVVPQITTDKFGHITGVTNKTFKVTDTDTNTWREIKVNGTQILANGTTTNALNLKAGTNMTLTNSSGTVTFDATDTGATAVTITGSGNAFTSAEYNASTRTITFDKGSTFLTSHQSLANYVTLNGNQTITGIKTFSHSTFGAIILKRNGSTNASSVIFQNNNGTLGSIGMTGTVNSGLKRWTADTNSSYTIWDSGNDGSGSGLDADLLDGKHASEFALVGDYLPKTTYEWNKEFAAGSNGAVSLGRYNLYDTQLTFDITTTTTLTISGKLVIAAQNGRIQKATIYGDASNTLANYLTIYQSAITNSRSWIEVFCNFPGWSKNKVHIYAVALNSATVTRQMTPVTFTGGVPSGVTSGDTKWTGAIVNDITTNCAAKNHTHDVNIATSTGTNELTLAYGTKYALTAGGQSFIFTMPTDSNTTYGADRGISLVSGKFGHSNTAVTAVTTKGLYKISYDAYGHITGTESFSLPTKNSWNYDDRYVKYNAAQTLTDAQKTQARTNIGAGTSSFSGSYNDLTNKPTIPTVNNATLTMAVSGTGLSLGTTKTFTANQSTNATITYTIDSSAAGNRGANKVVLAKAAGQIDSDKFTVTSAGATAVTMEYDSSYKALKFVFA